MSYNPIFKTIIIGTLQEQGIEESDIIEVTLLDRKAEQEIFEVTIRNGYPRLMVVMIGTNECYELLG